MKILVVCLGNICRSPLAEGVLCHAIAQRGLDWQVDSAGTGDWHIGDSPDRRSIAVAHTHDLDISGQRARQFRAADLDDFDLVLAMDQANRREILRHANTPDGHPKVQLYLHYAYPDAPPAEVPDPYWDDDGFEPVYQLLQDAAHHIVRRLEREYSTQTPFSA